MMIKSSSMCSCFGVKLQEDQEQMHMSLRSMSSFFLFLFASRLILNGDESCLIFPSGFLFS